MILKNLILIIIIILIQKINKFEFKNHWSNCSKIDNLLINDRKQSKERKIMKMMIMMNKLILNPNIKEVLLKKKLFYPNNNK